VSSSPKIRSIVYFGTPAFAVPSLEALVAAGRPPVMVVSQPARPAGRGRRPLEPPVAERARALGLAVTQPERVREPAVIAGLRELEPDLAVVVAFGQIFPESLLALPRLGCVNVHASLLPRWRGAAPIPAAIAAGDAESGVSIQRMELGLDTGPVYAERRTPVGDEENAEELAARLSAIGAELLLEVVESLERGEAGARAQDETRATYAPKLAGVRELDRTRPAAELAREVRAYGTEPGVALVVRGERVKVLEARAIAEPTAQPRGRVVGVVGAGLRVAAGAATQLELRRVQRAGGRPISGRDLANGLRLGAGDRL
jgi:methionyl-tRNA formyltransferase